MLKRLLKTIFLSLLLFTFFSSYTQDEANEGEEKNPAMKNAKMDFSKAFPEDITNENFPDMIESFDYPNAEIGEVVKAISKLTGKNFILDSSVRGKITIMAPSKITVAEAYKAFLSALAMNKLTIVPSGTFLKITPIRDAVRDSIETYTGSYFPNTDQIITRIIKLRYIDADEVKKSLGMLNSKSGSMDPYEPTNSLIITDFGTNIERIENVLKTLDVPGFEEKLAVIRIRHAKAKDIADMVNKIINKGETNTRSRLRRNTKPVKGGTGSESYSLVVSDDRSNSVIVVGNAAGITKIKKLIGQLDFPLNPDDAGGVYVYYVRHGEAEKIANVINGVAKEIESAKKSKKKNTGADDDFIPPSRRNENEDSDGNNNLFGGDVKITADKVTNSLIITSSKQDYKVVKNLLAKIDIPRDQVYVKAIIMGMNTDETFNWGVSVYNFQDGGENASIAPRMGFTTGNLSRILSPPVAGAESILGFTGGDKVTINVGGKATLINSLLGLVDFIKVNSGGNVLATPQVIATDNEEAEMESGLEVPVGTTTVAGANSTQTTSQERKDVSISLKFTPFISPDTDSVRLKIEQKSGSIANSNVLGNNTLAETAIATQKSLIKTNVVLNSGDTVILGGLTKEQETDEVRKIPILGDIPLLGWFFKGRNIAKKKESLMVFLTPRILRNSNDTDQLLSEHLDERLSFIQRSFSGKDPFGLVVDKFPRKSRQSTLDEDIDDMEEKEEPAVESF